MPLPLVVLLLEVLLTELVQATMMLVTRLLFPVPEMSIKGVLG